MTAESAAHVRRYLAAHRLYAPATGLVLLTAILVVWGEVSLSVPSDGANPVDFPLGRFLPMGYAVLVVGGLHSAMRSAEESGAPPLHRYRAVHLAVAILLGAVLITVALAPVSPVAAGVALRSYLAWTGLSLVSGRLFSWPLAWLLPIGTLFPLTYYGQGADGRPRWWDVTLAEPADRASAAAAAVLFLVGLAAFAATSWRRHALRRAFVTR